MVLWCTAYCSKLPVSCMCGGTAMRASCKPDTGPAQTDAPFVGDTTNRCDFTRKPTAPPDKHHPDPYVAPQGQMSSDTTNRRDFDRKPLNKTPAWRPKDRRRPAGQFEVNYDTSRLVMQTNDLNWSVNRTCCGTASRRGVASEIIQQAYTVYTQKKLDGGPSIECKLTPVTRSHSTEICFCTL